MTLQKELEQSKKRIDEFLKNSRTITDALMVVTDDHNVIKWLVDNAFMHKYTPTIRTHEITKNDAENRDLIIDSALPLDVLEVAKSVRQVEMIKGRKGAKKITGLSRFFISK